MAARNDFRASVHFSRIVDRPERADTERRARPGHLGAAIVKMPGLPGFAWMQVDREQGRQQAALSELRFGKSQRQRMNRKLRENRRLRQQGIYPVGLQALKIVAAG